eukprot:3626534-Prymnesium_polylepis.1
MSRLPATNLSVDFACSKRGSRDMVSMSSVVIRVSRKKRFTFPRDDTPVPSSAAQGGSMSSDPPNAICHWVLESRYPTATTGSLRIATTVACEHHRGCETRRAARQRSGARLKGRPYSVLVLASRCGARAWKPQHE